jgi:hypothetical protein
MTARRLLLFGLTTAAILVVACGEKAPATTPTRDQPPHRAGPLPQETPAPETPTPDKPRSTGR